LASLAHPYGGSATPESRLGKSVAVGRNSPDDHHDQVIKCCLRAVAETDWFEDWEFHTLFGLDRSEVEAVYRAWPSEPPILPDGFTSALDVQRLAVDNAMVNLLGYPHGHEGDAFTRIVGVSEADVADALTWWRGRS
jgi:hypothetical protein